MAIKVAQLDKKDIERLSCVSFIDINIIRRKLEGESVIFVAFDESEACGIIALEPVGVSHRLSYLFVDDKKRRRGIGRSLFDAVRIYDPKVYLEEGESLLPDIDAFLDACGYVLLHKKELYIFDRNEDTVAYCADFMRMHGDALMGMMRRHGFAASAMGMARPGLIETLEEKIGEGFDEEMNPFNIKNLDDDWSYIVHKDDEPAAFVACSSSKGELTVEMLAADRDHRGGGPAMMALVTLFGNILENDDIKRVATAVTGEDSDVVRLLDDKFYELITEKKIIKVFTLAE